VACPSEEREVRIGTRGSALALWQANWVADQLKAQNPETKIELIKIATSGDLSQAANTPLAETAGRGVFVKEIEAALLSGEIDAAVHSAKDMTSVETEGTVIAAFCERGDPRDALIAPKFGGLEALPKNALIATSSPRRIAQLLHLRPDLRFTQIRGNVDTRLRKLAAGEADALILAYAGLVRLGLSEQITEAIDPEVILPQIGQGCVAVQCRADAVETIKIINAACDHFTTRREVLCERAFLARIGGGCTAPIAGYAISSDRFLYLFALVASPDGQKIIRTRAGAHNSQVQTVADTAFEDLMQQGAQELLL
jgi:hydroxymethylbilane synthase